MTLLVDELSLDLAGGPSPAPIVERVCLSVPSGQTLALVGESGCGKSLTAMAVPRLLPPAVRIRGGRVILEGRDLGGLSDREMRGVRGARIGVVFQEPMTSLNPLMSIGRQIEEPLRVHRRLSGAARRARVMDLLSRVGIADAARRAGLYPHQFSGGMRQRALLAMALACDPALLIADEPTTALDVTVQRQVLALLASLQAERGLAILFITHDLPLIRRFAHRVSVMYAGRIVEDGPCERVIGQPAHPYTAGLAGSAPATHRRLARLPTIGGDAPGIWDRPRGCAFHPRCPVGSEDTACRRDVPRMTQVTDDRSAACFHPLGLAESALDTNRPRA